MCIYICDSMTCYHHHHHHHHQHHHHHHHHPILVSSLLFLSLSINYYCYQLCKHHIFLSQLLLHLPHAFLLPRLSVLEVSAAKGLSTKKILGSELSPGHPKMGACGPSEVLRVIISWRWSTNPTRNTYPPSEIRETNG